MLDCLFAPNKERLCLDGVDPVCRSEGSEFDVVELLRRAGDGVFSSYEHDLLAHLELGHILHMLIEVLCMWFFGRGSWLY